MPDLKSQISHLATKRKVVVLIKSKRPFFTQLEDFQKPKDTGLIGIFSTFVKPQLFDGYEKHFDAVFWFNASLLTLENLEEPAYRDKLTNFPEIDSILSEILQVIPASKLCLLETEEFFMKAICKLKEKFGISGYRHEDVEYLRDKSMLKEIVEAKKIPTMKYATLNFESSFSTIEEEMKGVLEKIPTFPIFYKPIKCGGSAGSGKLQDIDELWQFLNEENSKENKVNYLFEECISGKEKREFWAYCVLYPDGTCKPYSVEYMNQGLTYEEHLKTGKAMTLWGASLKGCSKVFPKLDEFVIDVVQKLKPPAPHVFCVQGFQLRPNSPEYLFTEVAYRIGGARGSGITLYGAGISQETVLLSCHLDPNYQIRRCPNYPETRVCMLWFPSVKGTLKSQNEVPKESPISSKLEYHWLKPTGSNMETAESVLDYLMYIKVSNESQELLEDDVLWIQQNYYPDII